MKPEGPRRPAGWGPWASGLGGRPAWAARAALLPSARQGWAAPRPPWPWRGRAAWAAFPSCSQWPSQQRQPQRWLRTRRSCPSPQPRARPAGHVRHPPRPSSSPAHPQPSAGAFGFSVTYRSSATRRGLGKCAQVAVVSSVPWSPGARWCLGFVAGSAQPHFSSSVIKTAIKIIPTVKVAVETSDRACSRRSINATFLPFPVQT